MTWPFSGAAESTLNQPSLVYRLRYYGIGAVLALSFMLLGRSVAYNDGLAQVYLPFMAATLLVMALAGIEYHLYTQRVVVEREAQLAKREEAELQAVERQKSFNQMWQLLADSRGNPLPVQVLTDLSVLFSADLVAVWSTDNVGAFHLAAAHPLANDGAVRLDKVAQMSPCFEKIREDQHLLRVVNLEQQTSKAFAWFCEENGFKEVVLCPVLVRRALVGVLALFYREESHLNKKLSEEIQAAANLFLCAL
jgi:transcriptional regulator with GAF, ATPase, and Fis domain